MTRHHEAADRYPLTWPVGWLRTQPADRKRATFGKSVTVERQEKNWQTGHVDTIRAKRSVALGSGDAAERLEYQLEALGASEMILSTNQRLRLDGRPRANEVEPADVGAAVYFRLNRKDHVLACDKWDRVADNIAALAAHVDAIRRIDRYGVGSLEQAFAGYQALPAKGQTWRTTLGFAPDEAVDVDMVNRAFRERARGAHPDAPNGSHDAMASLTQAKTEALQELDEVHA